MSERMIGTIITLMPNRGYGFVKGSEDRLSRFLHAKEVDPLEDFERLRVGSTVEFDPVEGGPAGNHLRAQNIKLIKDVK